MSAFVPDVPHARVDAVLTLTGERTIPDLDVENYWFRRHEVVYQRLAQRCAGLDVLEAGCGEGYGADLIAGVARRVTALDYDEATVAHVRARYPRVQVRHANLTELPLADGSVDVVVNFQVIEHLWDQARFVSECARALRPSGLLMVSTPNRITFSPGRDTPINPFHTRELNADELTQLLVDAGFPQVSISGLFHGSRLQEMDARHGGSIIDAQIARAVAAAPWPPELAADVALTNRRNDLSNLKGQIDYQVRTALLDLKASQQEVDVARSNVDLSNQTLTQARDRFSAGVADNLEVVQAQQSVADADQSLISAQYRNNLARVALARALGLTEEGIRTYFSQNAGAAVPGPEAVPAPKP